MKIKDIMTKKIINCDIGSDINTISQIMHEHDIGFVPITKHNKIVGVITDRDIVVKIIANNDKKIEGYISSKLITVDINCDINEALKVMSKNKIKRLLVSKEEDIVGIVSLSDIIKNDIDVCETIKQIWNLNKHKKEGNVSVEDYKL